MDDRTLQVIEFPRALELLAARCVSEPGRAAARALRPAAEGGAVGVMLDETGEATGLLGQGERIPLAPFADPDPWLEDIRRRGGALEPERFLAVASLLEVAAGAIRFLEARSERLPRLSARAAGADLLRPLAAQIRRVLDERGEVRDEASPDLARERGRIRSLRGEIRRFLDRVMAAHSSAIQETLIVQRRGRFVIPAKTNFRRSFEGVIQDRSGSGETLFVEPLGAVPLNNALAEARESERAEVERLLRELTAAAMESRAALAGLTRRLAALDLIMGKARLGVDWKGARAGESREGRIVLREARHPLLALEAESTPAGEAVPIGISVGGEIRQVVITGPNTGGKTVVLKTVGLCVALHQCGAFIPAGEGSELPLVRTLFADIGDEQDLRQNLSTFSGHMARVAVGVKEAGEGALLLLDELGAGTDPVEGSALGVAILEHLAGSGALAVVSTHHDALKHYAFVSPAAENASVEFDPIDLSPTYRLRMGAAGPSNALSVAERMGLPGGVLERARGLVQGGPVRPERVMARLEDQEKRLEEERADLAARAAEVAAAEEALARERLEEAPRRRREAEELIKGVRREADGILAELRAREDPEEARRIARERIHALSAHVEEALPPEAPAPAGEAVPHDFRIGDPVLFRSLGLVGSVRARHGGGMLTVEMNGKNLRVPAVDVELARGRAAPAEAKKTPRREEPSAAAASGPSGVDFTRGGEDEGFSLELHLRGRRAAEALEILDKYLDDAAVQGIRRVRVVHGKGTGALAEAVAGHLEGHALVSGYGPARPEEGDWGVTNVELIA
ncbi:MAG: Smr/MutS family protein [bacterium]